MSILRGRKRSLYKEPKYKKASEMIRIDSPASARASVDWLSKEWRSSKTRAKKRRLIKFATVAMNRAEIASESKRISLRERKEMKKVASIYRHWLRRHRLRER